MASDVVCIADEGSLPDGPFTALRYHFGMLLGLDDFETEQRYLRGKTRLHNAWLHGAGIVWGLGVDVVAERNEIRVAPGLALDGAGRELHLDVTCCMDIAAWYEEHAADAGATTDADGSVTFSGSVVLSFCACGTRPVPAIAGPCEGAEVDTAYSRTFETVSIRFVPGPAPSVTLPYPRLRLLFGLDDGEQLELPDREYVLVMRDTVRAQPAEQQPRKLLECFRILADLDAPELRPATSPDGEHAVPWPQGDDAEVVLAHLHGIRLGGVAGERQLLNWALDNGVRRTLVATSTIQELLCGPFLGGVAPGLARALPAAGGPRVTASDVDRSARTVTLTTDKPLAAATVGHDAFRVARLEAAGWEPIKVSSAKLSADGLSVTLKLRTDPGQNPLRVVARGTGQTPLLGEDHVPLAGGPDSPPGDPHDGHDYVLMSI
jgi:hypothetical protein